jgi:hypothetical protein
MAEKGQGTGKIIAILGGVTALIVAVVSLINVMGSDDSADKDTKDQTEITDGSNSEMADLRKEVADLKESDRDRKEDKLKQEIADLKDKLSHDVVGSTDFVRSTNYPSGQTELTGEWTDGTYDAKYQFSQYGDKIIIEQFLLVDKQWVLTASGEGTVIGGQLKIAYHQWNVSGTLLLTQTPDGGLEGSFFDSNNKLIEDLILMRN